MMSLRSIPSCHVMAKPTGSICNLDCKYCFYLDKSALYPDRKCNWKMSGETLEAFVKQHIEAQSGDTVQFAWQGGEPTLMGVAFYERVVTLCEKYANGKHITHAFQTNAILLDDNWCEFFKRNNFLVGVSIDGPEDLHDHYRVTRSGKPTHEKVLRGISYLQKHDVEFNTLTVVNNVNVKRPLAVYEYLKSIGSSYIQFIPLVEYDENGKVFPWTVPAFQYGEFLNKIFDHWVTQDVGSVFVNAFDSALATWCGHSSGMCVFAEECGHAFALEANGDLYQCDHYVYPEYLLGNIHDTSIVELNNSEEAIAFAKTKRVKTQECINCRYRMMCHGGCPKHRISLSVDGEKDQNYLCQGYKHFFSHTESLMKVMASLISHQLPASQIMELLATGYVSKPASIIPLNTQCPCGSNKKYKRCCHSL